MQHIPEMKLGHRVRIMQTDTVRRLEMEYGQALANKEGRIVALSPDSGLEVRIQGVGDFAIPPTSLMPIPSSKE